VSQAVRWTPREDATLRELAKTLQGEEVAEHMPGRTLSAVYMRCKVLRISLRAYHSEPRTQAIKDLYAQRRAENMYGYIPSLSELREALIAIREKYHPPFGVVAARIYARHRPEGWGDWRLVLKALDYPAGASVGWQQLHDDLFPPRGVPVQESDQAIGSRDAWRWPGAFDCTPKLRAVRRWNPHSYSWQPVAWRKVYEVR
jgi:hypothetical protein